MEPRAIEPAEGSEPPALRRRAEAGGPRPRMIDLEPLPIELSRGSTVKIADLAPVGSMTLLGDPHAAGEPDSVKTAPPTRRPAGGSPARRRSRSSVPGARPSRPGDNPRSRRRSSRTGQARQREGPFAAHAPRGMSGRQQAFRRSEAAGPGRTTRVASAITVSRISARSVPASSRSINATAPAAWTGTSPIRYRRSTLVSIRCARRTGDLPLHVRPDGFGRAGPSVAPE